MDEEPNVEGIGTRAADVDEVGVKVNLCVSVASV